MSPVKILTFLTDAHRHDRPEAWRLLGAAETTYIGDLLEEDPDADWAPELREEARLTYVQVAIALPAHTGEVGKHVTTGSKEVALE
jgi:hypothetical protein